MDVEEIQYPVQLTDGRVVRSHAELCEICPPDETLYHLGTMRRDGNGVGQDTADAAALFEESVRAGGAQAMDALVELAENESAEAQYLLGYLFLQPPAMDPYGGPDEPFLEYSDELTKWFGDGEPQYGASDRWFRRAAEQGHAKAQFKLAEGLLANEEYEEAVTWLEKAAERGESGAPFILGRIYAMYAESPVDYADEFDEDDEEAQELFVQKNYDAALGWLKRAEALGDSRAAYRLGEMYRFGYGVDADPHRALAYCQEPPLNR